VARTKTQPNVAMTQESTSSATLARLSVASTPHSTKATESAAAM